MTDAKTELLPLIEKLESAENIDLLVRNGATRHHVSLKKKERRLITTTMRAALSGSAVLKALPVEQSVGAKEFFSIRVKEHTVLINKDDYERLGFPRLTINIGGGRAKNMNYVRIYIKGSRGYLHRLLLNAPKNMLVDHINGDTLDNRICNLRLATPSQNMGNSKSMRGTSKYKGVHWSKKERKWVAGIKNGVHLGYFNDENEAALAYNKAALEHFGEFSRLNIIGGNNERL